jgi:hypothetical protein
VLASEWSSKLKSRIVLKPSSSLVFSKNNKEDSFSSWCVKKPSFANPENQADKAPRAHLDGSEKRDTQMEGP